MRKIEYSRRFTSILKKCPLRIKRNFVDILETYIDNPTSLILNKHSLKGKYKGCQSLNLTEDWRVIIIERKNSTIIVDIGTHKELYD